MRRSVRRDQPVGAHAESMSPWILIRIDAGVIVAIGLGLSVALPLSIVYGNRYTKLFLLLAIELFLVGVGGI